MRLPITELTVERAENLSKVHGLRAYDAVHLSTALIWKETALRPTHMATYDWGLWLAAQKEGLQVLPEGLP